MEISKAVDEAQLTVDELAYLCGVSRVTASKWVNGRTKPHSLVRARVNKMLSRIETAIGSGQLPLKKHSERRVIRERETDASGKVRRQPAYVRDDVLKILVT